MAGHGDAKPRGCLEKISHAIDSRMNAFFAGLGRWVAVSPGKTLALVFVVVVIGVSGIRVLETEGRGEKLWVPTGTRANEDYASYLSYFPKEGRENLIIAVPTDGGDALSQENLLNALEVFQKVSEITVAYEGVDYALADLCVASPEFEGTPCQVESVLGLWGYEESVLAADASVLSTINNGTTVNELENYMGGMTLSDDGLEVASAEALRIMILLKNTEVLDGREYLDPIPDAWEEVFIDVAQECTDGLDCFVEATRSLSDEFGNAISGDISLISASYMIILAYTVINLSGRPLLKSRILLSLGAILTVGLSIAFSIGLASYMGFFYTPLHTVLPFVLLGLGVDDSFVICNAFGRTDPRKPLPDRIAEGLGTSGVSITVTSLTDFAAFLISSTTRLPALSSFCVYAALGVLAVYVLQSTLFVAFLVYDARRQEAGRLDCCPCFKTKTMDKRPSVAAAAAAPPGQEWDEKLGDRGRLAKFVSGTYAPLLTKKPIKAFVVLMFGVILVFCGIGAGKLDVDDTDDAFIPDGSYLLALDEAREKYFGGVGVGVEIVTEAVDYFEMQSELAAIPDRLTGLDDENSPYIQDPATSGTFFSWFGDLIVYAEAEATATLVESGDYTVFSLESEFYSTLEAFLVTTDGLQYNSSVVFDTGDGTIRASAIQAEYSGEINGDAAEQVDAMVDMRNLVDSWDVVAFPWSERYLQWETFRIIYQELYQGLGLCLLTVFILTLILIAHPGMALLVFLMVTFTIVDVLGIMYYWGLAIDTVAVINLVLAVGLSVDYAAHVAHSFMLKSGTKDERMMQAVSDIGVAVIHGGVSTFLAVVLLSLSSSYVFRVLFKQFFSTAVMGLGHGLILLPVLLSVVGPAAYGSAGDSGDAKVRQTTMSPMGGQSAVIATGSKVTPSGGGYP